MFYVAALVLVMSACSQEDGQVEQSGLQAPQKFSVSIDRSQTRTYIDAVNQLHWTAGDLVSVFARTTENLQYKYNGATGDVKGEIVATGTPQGSGIVVSDNYAIYPYSANNTIDSQGKISLILPSMQNYVVDSFGLGDNVMVARSSDENFSLKNVCGCLKLLLYRADYKVKSITLKGNNGEKLSGSAMVMFQNGLPVVTMASGASQSIILDCGSGVTLGSTAETATPFWFVVPPTTFTKGFTVTVTDTDGKEINLTTDKPQSINRNAINPMKPRVVKSIDPKNVFVNGVPKKVGEYTITLDINTGLVSKILRNEEDGSTEETTFTYPTDMTASPLQMTMTSVSRYIDSGGFQQSTRVMTLTLDEESLFVKNAIDNGNEAWVFTYSEDGYLTSFVCTDGYDSSTKGIFNYENGDIISTSEIDGSQTYNNTIVNSGIENKGCIMLHSDTYRLDIEQYVYAYYAGLLGKAAKHLPASVSGPDNYTFNWKLNAQGFPIELSEANSWSSTLIIEW